MTEPVEDILEAIHRYDAPSRNWRVERQRQIAREARREEAARNMEVEYWHACKVAAAAAGAPAPLKPSRLVPMDNIAKPAMKPPRPTDLPGPWPVARFDYYDRQHSKPKKRFRKKRDQK